MGSVRRLPELEARLDARAESWSSLEGSDYKRRARRWSEAFLPPIKAGCSGLKGHRAIREVEARLPAEVIILAGLRVFRLANMGGAGAAGYRAVGIRSLCREMANRCELIVSSPDFAWTCVFTHEAGSLGTEQFFEQSQTA